MNPTIPWLSELHTPNYLSSSFCSFVGRAFLCAPLQILAMYAETGLHNYKSTLDQDKSQVGNIDYKPQAFETQSVIFYRIEYHLKKKIQPDVL
jgi:hypothetical protein